jgi:RES domain
LTLTRDELNRVAAWTDKAQPFCDVYFRSVSYTFMDPETALNGRGTAVYGGRFASKGTAAVYLAESDAVATNEVTGRKKRLGGAALIGVDKYPRLVFAVRFELQRVLNLAQRSLPPDIRAIRDKCLGEDLHPSQQFGDILISRSIDGLRFQSHAGPGVNLVVYKKNCDPDALKIENEAALRATIAAIAASRK